MEVAGIKYGVRAGSRLTDTSTLLARCSDVRDVSNHGHYIGRDPSIGGPWRAYWSMDTPDTFKPERINKV